MVDYNVSHRHPNYEDNQYLDSMTFILKSLRIIWAKAFPFNVEHPKQQQQIRLLTSMTRFGPSIEPITSPTPSGCAIVTVYQLTNNHRKQTKMANIKDFNLNINFLFTNIFLSAHSPALFRFDIFFATYNRKTIGDHSSSLTHLNKEKSTKVRKRTITSNCSKAF